MTGWARVGRAGDVPPLEGRRAEAHGRRIAIFRLADGFVAIDHACPHAGGPLSDGLVADDGCVTCPLHGWRFDLRDGARAGGAPGEGVAVHEVRERDGELWVRLAIADDLAPAA